MTATFALARLSRSPEIQIRGRVLATETDRALQRTDYAERRRPAIAWADAAPRYAWPQQLVGDSTTTQAWYTGARAGSASLQQAVALLATATTQDTEPDPAGVGVRIAQRVAADRVISTGDPAMRPGRKTSAHKVDGKKSHQLTQSVPPAAGARLITAHAADGAPLPDLVAERAALTGVAPAQVMGNTAYGPTMVVAPVLPANHRAARFPKGAFTLDLAAETVTCPQGETVGYGAVRPRRRDGVRVVRWARGHLRDLSPARAMCGGGRAGYRPRTVAVRPDEAQLRARRAAQATPARQAHYRLRSHVEHVQAQQSRHGGRQGRYWGFRKNLRQARLVAALYNI